MIVGLILAASLLGLIAGVLTLLGGFSVWIALAVYAGTGMLTVLLLCLLPPIARRLFGNRHSVPLQTPKSDRVRLNWFGRMMANLRLWIQHALGKDMRASDRPDGNG